MWTAFRNFYHPNFERSNMLIKVAKGESWQKTFVANEDLVICGECKNHISWKRGDFWSLPNNKKINCPHCGGKIMVGDLLP